MDEPRTHSGIASLMLAQEYRTGEASPAEGFFEPVLRVSVKYDRAVGYFRSAFLVYFGHAILPFVRQGGRIRLVCSPELTDDDIQSMSAGFQERNRILADSLTRDVDTLLSNQSTADAAKLLATLIALEVLDVRIAVRTMGRGIFHEKLGVFVDAHGGAASFKGSSNETWSAWHPEGNFESIEVFCTHWSESDGNRVRNHSAYFERLWSNQVSGLEVVEFPEATKRRLLSVARDSVEDCFPTQVRDAQGSGARDLLPHQVAALSAWETVGCRGILEHATGSGKTVTAIRAIAMHTSRGNPAIVLVPSSLLLEQWRKELQRELGELRILMVGDRHETWRKGRGRLQSFTLNESSLGARVVLGTMQTASTAEFLRQVQGGEHLLLVIDEVHQAGSTKFSKLLNINAGKRLGLSATPRRYGDEIGTEKLISYFNGIVQPPFTLLDALRAGRLVPYRYFPHSVMLTDDEEERWEEISAEISREVARSQDGNTKTQARLVFSERAKLLLIQRSRIAKKARNKTPLALRVLAAEYVHGQRWLVYCDDREQLSAVVSGLREQGLPALEYFSDMDASSETTLNAFKEFGGILVAIRCLDEGVDIPEVSHALILASSQNPRQFIQRRGRVLRCSPGKQYAVIHDALVRPVSSESNPLQLGHFHSELLRAMEFARTADNPASLTRIMEIATEVGLDPLLILDEASEDEVA